MLKKGFSEDERSGNGEIVFLMTGFYSERDWGMDGA
jgi:hypothetical protein